MEKYVNGIYAVGKHYVVNLNDVSSYNLACLLDSLNPDEFNFKRDKDLLFITKK